MLADVYIWISIHPSRLDDSAMVEHRKLVAHGRVSESDHPKVSALIAAFVGWAEEYDNTPHCGTGMEGATPRQVFNANRNPRQRPAPDEATLTLLMAEREKRLRARVRHHTEQAQLYPRGPRRMDHAA